MLSNVKNLKPEYASFLVGKLFCVKLTVNWLEGGHPVMIAVKTLHQSCISVIPVSLQCMTLKCWCQCAFACSVM